MKTLFLIIPLVTSLLFTSCTNDNNDDKKVFYDIMVYNSNGYTLTRFVSYDQPVYSNGICYFYDSMTGCNIILKGENIVITEVVKQ